MSHLSKPIFYLTLCMIALAMVCLPPFCIALFTIISRGSLFFLADTRFHVYPINKSEHILPLSYSSLQPFLILFTFFIFSFLLFCKFLFTFSITTNTISLIHSLFSEILIPSFSLNSYSTIFPLHLNFFSSFPLEIISFLHIISST